MKNNKQTKIKNEQGKVYIIVLIVLCIILIFGFVMKGKTSTIPFNGSVVFYDLSIEIPKDFIRDSTKSNDNQYVFEKNNYDVIIVISKQNTNGYSLRNMVNSAKNENGTVLYSNNEYTKCDIKYMLNGGVYSFAHSQIYNDIRYQIIIQSKDETKAKLVYDDLIPKAIFGENEN